MKTLMRHNTETGRLLIYAKYGQEHAIIDAEEFDPGAAHRLNEAIRKAEEAAYQAGAAAVRVNVIAAAQGFV